MMALLIVGCLCRGIVWIEEFIAQREKKNGKKNG